MQQLGEHAAARARPLRWSASKARLRWRLYLLLGAVDALVLFLAHATAGALRFGNAFDFQAMKICAALLPLYAVAAFATNAFTVPVLLDAAESVRRGLKALALALTGAMFFIFLLQFGAQVSRFTFAVSAVIACVGLATARWFLGRNATAILGGDAYDVVVICDGVLDLAPDACTVFVDAAGIDPANQTPTNFDRLGRLAQGADRVVVACPPERRMLWAAALQGANVQGEVIAPELAQLRPLGIARHDAAPTLIVAREPLSLRDRVLKRGFDVVIASVLVCLLAPLLLGVALAVWLTSPGPALFHQTRIGRRNMQFSIFFKFRTMRVEVADAAGARSAWRGDDRVTPVGRMLRATSIDELPQLFNVLRGEMSLVGPRPHALGSRAGDQLFWELDSRYWDRHAIKPGLTGLAQVRGLRGATAAGADLTERLRADLEYRSHWSIWKDIGILLRTAPALFRRNAF